MKLYKMPARDYLSAILHSKIYKLMLHKMSSIFSVVARWLPVEALAKALPTFMLR